MPKSFISNFLTNRKFATLLLAAAIALSSGGCSVVGSVSDYLLGAVGVIETGTVISKRANIRSSYAVVAADILEVRRGQQLDILDEYEYENVVWYRVRASDEDETEGWIEAQHIIREESLERSRQLAVQDQELPAQASGQLRAMSNLRLTPEQADDNILLLLDSGSTFEIVDWEYVTKAPEETEGEDENEEIAAAREEGEPEKIDDKYDLWYKIRLDPSVSPAPMGWVYGRQIELQVPSDIVYFQSNDRKFVTWLRLDDLPAPPPGTPKDTATRISRPGSWVVLSRTNEVRAVDGKEPDFDGILVLGFDKYNEEHYTVYSTRRERYDVWGVLPVKMEGAGDNKSFTVKLRNAETGEIVDKTFEVYRDQNRRIRINAPEDMDKFGYKEKKR